MEFLHPILLSVHILIGLGVIGLVLIQHGKGADMGAAFGSGTSGSLFGASGSANFMSRTTGVLAAMFFMTSLALSYIASSKPRASGSVMDSAVTTQPAVPIPAAPQAPVPSVPGDSKAKDIPR